MRKLASVFLGVLLGIALIASPVLAADFDARQGVRISDGTDDFGVTTAKPLTVQLSDGGELATITSNALDVNIASGGVAPTAVDDSAFTIATDDVSPSGYLVDETTPDSADEGDVALARMTADRKQLMVMVDATTDSQRLAINGSGAASVNVTNSVISVDDNASSLTVDGTVAATQSGTWNINTLTSITNDVNIADGGNIISVDDGASSLTIDNATLSVTGGGTEASALRVTIANDSTGVLSIDDNGTSITVDASQLDIDDLSSATDSVEVLQDTHDDLNANANLQVANTDVSTSNPVPVKAVEPAASSNEVHDYDTASAIAKSATDNHDYTVTGTTFFLTGIKAAASGAMKVELQTGPVAGLATDAVFFTSASNPTLDVSFDPPIEVPVTSTGTVRLIRTNRDNTAQDLYSTIIGYDI